MTFSFGEVKDETTFRYAHLEIRTWVVVISEPTRYRETMEAPLQKLKYNGDSSRENVTWDGDILTVNPGYIITNHLTSYKPISLHTPTERTWDILVRNYFLAFYHLICFDEFSLVAGHTWDTLWLMSNSPVYNIPQTQVWTRLEPTTWKFAAPASLDK